MYGLYDMTTTDKNPENALVKSSFNNNSLVAFQRKSLIALTESILSNSNQLSTDEWWMKAIWEWADEFRIDDISIPRNRSDLLDLEKLIIPPPTPKSRERKIFGGMGVNYGDEDQRFNDRLARVKTIPHIPVELAYLKKLITLSIPTMVESGLDDFLSDLSRLNNLRDLTIEFNAIKNISEDFGRIKSLEKISLLYNQISIIPKPIYQLENLKILLIERNNIDIIPDDIGNLEELTELVITNCGLNEISEKIGKLVTLNKLNLRRNNLILLPNSISELINLEELNLNDNNIHSLPNNIGIVSSQ